jgi:hypothetical protein
MKLRINTTIIVTGVLWLTACGAQFSGTYEDVSGVTRYHFMSDGSAQISALGSTVAADYILDGNRILLSSPQGTVVLTRKDDRLYGPMGLELLRQGSD